MGVLLRPVPKIWLDRRWKFSDAAAVQIEERAQYGHVSGWLVPELDLEHKRFLLVTAMPWWVGKLVPVPKNYMLARGGAHGCQLCPAVVQTHWALPMGNLRPKFLVVGDAPSHRPTGFAMNSAWTGLGNVSRLLRRALATVGIYWDCWMTNLLKCPCPENRVSSDSEQANCRQYLKRELDYMKPQTVIMLGKHVQQSFPSVSGYKMVAVKHPSFYVRKGGLVKAMVRDLEEKL